MSEKGPYRAYVNGGEPIARGPNIHIPGEVYGHFLADALNAAYAAGLKKGAERAQEVIDACEAEWGGPCVGEYGCLDKLRAKIKP